ncbi:MAG: sigma-70 family RNA polymerase sigma factor [Planctomycetota bacterium]|nr:sigma-70 family RNA polymerase sigma factor [Planctomycetota bacterium]
MPAPRANNAMIGRNSPLDRVRSRTRSGLGSSSVRPGGNGAARKRTSRAGVRPLARREEIVLATILEKPVDYIDSEVFLRPDAEEHIYGLEEVDRPDVSWYRPLMEDVLPSRGRPEMTKKGKSVLLTAAQERVLFLKYNYARHRMRGIQIELDGRRPDLETAREILRWHAVADQYREQIAETNLALVLAMAKRVRIMDGEFADLVSEGNMALMRSVDKFDCGRGFKFSTYACRAILKAFSRHGMKSTRHRQRFPTDFDPAYEKSDFVEARRAEQVADSADEVRFIMSNNRAELSKVERTVILHRFGIGDDRKQAPLTLEQVGQLIGVTKERVRQIQNKALSKLRTVIEEGKPLDDSEPREN